MKEIIDIVHKSIYPFFDVCENEEEPLSDKDKLLLKVNKAICNNLKALEQEPKTGHWITWKEAGNEIASETKFECSVCHDSAQTLCNGLDLLSPYCPNCGARMVELEERSDKE